jgi:DNA helicase HerA-like ATPase
MNTDHTLKNSIFRIGKVISVEGARVKVKVDKTKNASHLLYKGDLLKNVSVGSYIKIIKGFVSIIAKIDAEYINEDKQFSNKDYVSNREKIDRVLKVILLGHLRSGKFERGLTEIPLIDNECFLLEDNEFREIHNFIKRDDEAIDIGTLTFESQQKFSIGVNSTFASHIGVFGNTGSGKSYTLAKIIRKLFEKYKDNVNFKKNTKFFLIDFNGEYEGKNTIISENNKKVFKLSTRDNSGDKFPISNDEINDSEFWMIFLEATDKTQAPFLRRAIDTDYLEEKISSQENFKNFIYETIESIVLNPAGKTVEKATFSGLLRELQVAFPKEEGFGKAYKELEKLHYHTKSKAFYIKKDNDVIYSTDANKGEEFKKFLSEKTNTVVLPKDICQIDKIRLKIILKYYDEIIRGFSNIEHLAPLMRRMDKRMDDLKKVIEVKEQRGDNSKNFIVLSLDKVNLRTKKLLPLLICKYLYNQKKRRDGDNEYLNIIIDEAHNILCQESERESQHWKDYRLETFEEIIKEGRKFGVFLTIASQRPSDISPTIISQLHHYFLHRLINNEDIRAVEKTISFLDKVSFDLLPLLPTGTCIFAGIGANMPIMVDIEKIETENEPDNKTITLVDKWKEEANTA